MTCLFKTTSPAILYILFGSSLVSPIRVAVSLPMVLPVLICDALDATDSSTAVGTKITINYAEMQTSARGSWCKISVTTAPQIGMQVALPTQRWNRRSLQVDCDGLYGSTSLSLSNASGCLSVMNGEFMMVAADTGCHGSMTDAPWAEDPQKYVDFAWRANHPTAMLTRAVIQTLYRQQSRCVYFMSCSDGSHEALMEVQRFP